MRKFLTPALALVVALVVTLTADATGTRRGHGGGARFVGSSYAGSSCGYGSTVLALPSYSVAPLVVTEIVPVPAAVPVPDYTAPAYVAPAAVPAYSAVPAFTFLAVPTYSYSFSPFVFGASYGYGGHYGGFRGNIRHR